MRSIFAPSLLLVCYLHLRCANSCVLPSSRRSSIEWKTKLNYTRTGCRFTYYCVFGSCQRFVVRKSLLFFGFVRGVSVAVHTSQRPRTTYQRHDNILHTIWACKHVWQDVYARERASQHRHCVAIRDTLIPRRSTPNVAASTHWVRSIRIIHIIKTASEWYFFFLPAATDCHARYAPIIYHSNVYFHFVSSTLPVKRHRCAAEANIFFCNYVMFRTNRSESKRMSVIIFCPSYLRLKLTRR